MRMYCQIAEIAEGPCPPTADTLPEHLAGGVLIVIQVAYDKSF